MEANHIEAKLVTGRQQALFYSTFHEGEVSLYDRTVDQWLTYPDFSDQSLGNRMIHHHNGVLARMKGGALTKDDLDWIYETVGTRVDEGRSLPYNNIPLMPFEIELTLDLIDLNKT